MASGSPHPARFLTGAILLGAVGAALSVDMVAPGNLALASAADTICMGAVIDYSGVNTAQSSQVLAQGLSVSPGTSDLQALAMAGDSVSQNDSGLVCAINGWPTDGVQACTSKSGNDYFYWSYWQGDPYANTWTYANIGPAEHQVAEGQTYVEGWRYQNPGADNSSAPPPSESPADAFAQACPGVAPVPQSSGSPTTTPTTSPSATPTTAPSLTTTTTTASRPSPSVTHSTSPGSTGGHATTTSSTTTTTTPIRSTTTTALTTTPKRQQSASAPVQAPAQPGSGDPLLPALAVAAVVAVLGGVAFFRWRRRPVEE